MGITSLRMFKLDQDPKGYGLRCDKDGLFYAGGPLLERDLENRYKPRSAEQIQKVLGVAGGAIVDLASCIRSVDVVSRALNKGDLARAMMSAVLMRIPHPNDAIRAAEESNVLAKAGFDTEEPRDERGRWTSGGGSDQGRLTPAQATVIEPLFGPMIEEFPADPLMLPRIDVVPPMTIPRGLAREPASNPFPRRRECVKEWAAAEKFCRDLINKGKLGGRGNREFGATYDQCVKGQVSEDCGGSSTAFELIA